MAGPSLCFGPRPSVQRHLRSASGADFLNTSLRSPRLSFMSKFARKDEDDQERMAQTIAAARCVDRLRASLSRRRSHLLRCSPLLLRCRQLRCRFCSAATLPGIADPLCRKKALDDKIVGQGLSHLLADACSAIAARSEQRLPRRLRPTSRTSDHGPKRSSPTRARLLSCDGIPSSKIVAPVGSSFRRAADLAGAPVLTK